MNGDEKRRKKYMNSVIQIIIKKYNRSEIEAYKLVKKSFLYDSLLKFPDETIHDDIETNADFVYEEYTSGHFMEL